MSNEWKDWVNDATNDDVMSVYQTCISNGWEREANLYEVELVRRGIYLGETGKR